MKAFLLSYLFPGSVGLIARWDGKELRQTTIAALKNLLPPAMIHRWNDQMGEIEFKRAYGGSVIYYGDLKEERAIKNYDLSWCYVDQAEEIDEERWSLLLGRTRRLTPLLGPDGPLTDPLTRKPLYVPNFNFCTFNAEHRGSYLYRFFHPNSLKRLPGYQLYEANTYDAERAGFVTTEYVEKLKTAYPDYAQKRYLEGCWDMFEGRVYPAFSEATHVVPDLVMEPWWTLYEVIDVGLTNPTCVLWIAVDDLDTWYVLDEHYEGGGRSAEYHAAVILEKRRRFPKAPDLTYMDSHCWAQNQTFGGQVYSIAQEYARHGIHAIPAPKNWDAAFSHLTAQLMVSDTRRHPLTKTLGAPGLLVAARCRNLIQEWLMYHWKKQRGTILRNAPDEPVDYQDHAMDAMAYFATGVRRRGTPPPSAHPTPLERWHLARSRYNPLAEAPLKGASPWSY